MKQKTKLPGWIAAMLAVVVLAGSASLGHAQSAIVYNFASDLEGWSGDEPAGFPATYSWDAAGGSTGGGCMEVQFGGTGTNEMDPIVTLPSTLNQEQYFQVSIHMKVDSSSGTTGTGGSGGYGNLQAVFRDASYSWDSIWYGAVYPPAANGWVTYTFTIPSPYKPAEQYLQFQFQGNSGTGYSAPVTVYIDNITISPVPNPWVIDAFTNASEITAWNPQSWTGVPSTSSLNASQDAGGGFTPSGAMELDCTFPSGGYNQAAFQNNQSFDPSRFTYLDMDVKVDPSSTLAQDGTYGSFDFVVMDQSYGWHGTSVTLTNTSWTHLHLPMPVLTTAQSPSQGFVIDISDGGWQGPITVYVDNIKASFPVTLPIINSLTKNTTPGGAQMTVDADGTANQYDQEGICTPSAVNATNDCFWIGQFPATYSFTLTNFPAPSVAPGFDAHIYLVNGDSIAAGDTGGMGYNETYSGCNYNAYDLAALQVQNGTNGGVICNFLWKTNAPSSNATNGIYCVLTNLASANGAWSLNFSDNTHGSILLNGATVTNFTLPDFSSDPNYSANFSPATSFIQFGVFKNDANKTGMNNNQSAIVTQVMVTNAASGTLYSDSFGGPGLTANYGWQIAEYYQDSANRVLWIPRGTAYWVEWNTTQTGYSVQSTNTLSAVGPWPSAGVSYTYPDATGTNTIGAIPTASLPPGNAAFFRLSK